jgi:hypothetical protein
LPEVSPQTLCDESNYIKSSSKRFANLENSNTTLNQILLVLFDALQEYMSLNNIGEKILSNQINMDSLIDINNNNVVTTVHDIKQNCLNTDVTENIANTETINKYTTGAENYVHEKVQTNDYNYNSNIKNCYSSLKSDHYCVCTSQPIAVTKPCEKTTTFSMKDFSTAINNLNTALFDSTKIYERCKKSSCRDISNDFSVSKIKSSANLFISM